MDNKIIYDYLEYIKTEKNLSENTMNSYKMDLKKYIDYLKQKDIHYSQVNENDLFSFLIYLEETNISVSTISRMISSIKSFHEFLFLNKLTPSNPSKKIKKPKIEKEKIEVLTEGEIEKLLSLPELDSIMGIRDKAILETFYGTGMKVTELTQLDVENVNIDMEYINCIKSKNSRIIPLGSIAKKYILKYIENSREKIVKNKEEKTLFVNAKGERFTRQGLWKIIKRYTEKLNTKKNITPTMLRHSFAIHLLSKGADITIVGKILGNSNLSSLQGYLNHLDKNIRKEFKEKHPRG